MERIKVQYINKEQPLTFAFIELGFAQNQQTDHKIVIHTTHIPFRSQGQIESGYETWNLTAHEAIACALGKLELSKMYVISILNLQRRIIIDTNNAAIGIACILALYQYLNIDVSSEERKRLDLFVSENWNHPQNVVPNFSSLFSNA